MTTTPTGCPVSQLAAAFDPFTGPYQENPGTAMAAAREQEPVFYSPELDYWVVTRYEDCRQVFRDTANFSAAIVLAPITPLPEAAVPILMKYEFGMAPVLVDEDEPLHMARRRALMEPFLPENIARLEPGIRRLVNDSIDRFVKQGHADFVADFLWKVPAVVGLTFLGVPDDMMEEAESYVGSYTLFVWGRPTEDDQLAGCEGMGRFWQFSRRVVERIGENPVGDSWLAHAWRVQREQPDLIDANYITNLMMSGTLASHETTTNASGNAFRALLEHPDQWAAICADPSLIPGAVEECLRFSSSVVAWRRLAVKDTEVGGVTVPAGAKLLLVTASGNYDDAVFREPERLDITRDNARRHLAFGYSNHACMGAALARMEMQVILEETSRRLPHLRLVPGQDFGYLPNTSFRGPRRLLVEWDPEANPVPADRP